MIHGAARHNMDIDERIAQFDCAAAFGDVLQNDPAIDTTKIQLISTDL